MTPACSTVPRGNAPREGPRALRLAKVLRGIWLADSISDARLGRDQIAQLAGWVCLRELSAKPAHVHVDVAVLASIGLAPHGAEQPALRHEAATVCEEHPQDLELARRQLHGLLADANE